MKKFQADVIIAGAGSAGCYLSMLLLDAGFRVIILEKRRLSDLGKHIDVFHMDEVRFKEFNIPLPEGKERFHYERSHTLWSPDLRTHFEVSYPFYVMHKPSFHQRMHRYVRARGGRILERAEVTGVLIEDGACAGVRGMAGRERFEARGRIVVDATGLKGAIRTRLPRDFGLETDGVTAEDSLFVCLEFRDRIKGDYPTGSNGYIHHKSFWNLGRSAKEVILGIGQPQSYAYAWQKHAEWREEYFGDPGRVVKRIQGSIPFRRSPLSLVGNGFMTVGDAACQNKPFSGEGVTSGFTACKIAAEVAVKALRAGDTSRNALWEYNVRYFRGQGAKFAAGLAQLPPTAELSSNDVNFLFKKGIIFNKSDFEELSLRYEVAMSAMKTILVSLRLLWGVIRGDFSSEGLGRLMKASGIGAKMKRHYIGYPDNPSRFEAWADKALALWREAR